MDVRWITQGGLEHRRLDELDHLLTRIDGFVWLDAAVCDDHAAEVLSQAFGFHPLAIKECRDSVSVAKIHVYGDHFFVVLHDLEHDQIGGFVAIEHDQFVGLRYLVTVHNPSPSSMDPAIASRDADAVLARIEAGRFHPRVPGEVGHAIVSAFVRRQESFVGSLARDVNALERQVRDAGTRNSHALLNEMFEVRHQLLSLRTTAGQSREVYARMVSFSRGLPDEATLWIDDALNHYERLCNVCDGERELLQEILDFYQTRVATELNEFVKRLTSFGAILVAATLIAGIYGMNFAHMPELDWRFGYPLALGMMLLTGGVLAWYFRRKGWL
jgi:magnesium transporter